MIKFWFKYYWTISLFLRKWFQLRHSKIAKKKKSENSLSKCLEHSILISRLFQNHFLKSFLRLTLNLNGLKALPRFPRKRFQLRHSKIANKLKIFSFQMLRTFVFDLKVVSKPFSTKLPMTNYEFKWCWRLSLAFLENGFNFAKNWKVPFSNTRKKRFWAQDSFKTIF